MMLNLSRLLAFILAAGLGSSAHAGDLTVSAAASLSFGKP